MPTEIHAFDLDKTLITTNSSFKFGQFLYRKHYFSLFTMFQLVFAYALHKAGFLSITTLHHYNFRKIFQRRPASQVYDYAAEFAETVILYHPCWQALIDAQRKNHHTVILSNSPDFVVRPIAKRLGVAQTFSTHYEIDKDHRFCKISSIMLGNHKATTIHQYATENKIPLNKITVYSDSHLDLQFLEAAAHPIGVNPDKELRKICEKKNWPII